MNPLNLLRNSAAYCTIFHGQDQLTLKGITLFKDGKEVITLDDRCNVSTITSNFAFDHLINGQFRIAFAGTSFVIDVTRNPIPASKVKICTTSYYIRTGKKKPAGKANWGFSDRVSLLFIAKDRNYTDARRDAIQWAAKRGICELNVA